MDQRRHFTENENEKVTCTSNQKKTFEISETHNEEKGLDSCTYTGHTDVKSGR